MTLQDCSRDLIREPRSLIAAPFQLVQRIQSHLLVLRILLVPLRDARVKIPTVIIEARRASELLHFRMRFALEVFEANNNVGHLYTGVIDVVLHIHGMRGFTQ